MDSSMKLRCPCSGAPSSNPLLQHSRHDDSQVSKSPELGKMEWSTIDQKGGNNMLSKLLSRPARSLDLLPRSRDGGQKSHELDAGAREGEENQSPERRENRLQHQIVVLDSVVVTGPSFVLNLQEYVIRNDAAETNYLL